MRPLKLTMHHFGPFLDETIDFNQMDQELFLITGPTGSGKTTIFDGMCYALYGEGSNTFRQAREMKSQFGDPLEMMWVDFTFKLRDKIYRIRRVPEQERRRTRGEGTAVQKHEVALYEGMGAEEQLISASVDEVRTIIPELLGITATQFRQIVMLPQGEFSRLLKASADERVALLKSIFRMDLYQKLRDKMTGKLRSVKEKREVLITRLGSEKEHIDASRHIRLAEALKEDVETGYLLTLLKEAEKADADQAKGLEDSEQQLQKALDALEAVMARGRQINEQFERLEVFYQKRRDQKDRAEEMAQRQTSLNRGEAVLRVRPLKEQQDQTEAQKKGAEQERDSLLKQQTDLKAQQERAEQEGTRVSSEAFEAQLDQLRVQFETLNELAGQVEPFIQKQQHFSKAAAALEKLEIDYQGMREASEQLTACRLKVQEHAHQLQKLKSHREALVYQVKALQGQQVLVSGIEEKFKQVAACDKTIKVLREAWKVAKQEKDQKEKVLVAARIKNREQLAYILSEGLKEGMPCPVCGSVHHVHPVEAPSDPVSDNKLHELEKAFQAAVRQQDEKAIEGKNEARKKVELEASLEKQMQEAELDFDDLEAVQEQKKALAKQLKALKKQQQDLEESLRVQDGQTTDDQKALEALEAKTQRLEETEAHLNEARRQTQQLQGELNTMKAQLEEQLKKAQWTGHLEEDALTEKICQAAGRSEKAFQEKNDEKEQALKQLQAVREALAAVKSRLKLRMADIEAFSETIQAQKASFEAALAAEKLSMEDYCRYQKVSREQLDQDATVLREYDFDVRETSGRIEELEALLKDQSPVDLGAQEEEKKAHKMQLETVRSQREALSRRRVLNRQQAEKIEELSQALKTAEKEMGVCVRLDETLKGSVKGRAKISFERYILSAYLQDILESANIFLEAMSSGRYRLEVMTDRQTGRGLDIEVVDAYTGLRRSANTLSGGETFMAALSMALGLSDSVQSAAGGISLDTIFIDEGFATLDPEALDKAISCLLTIQDDGRMVGLISHVEELKERIDTRITIEKTESGSHIRY